MNLDEAVATQERFRQLLVTGVPLPRSPALVAGVDVAYESDAVGSRVAGAVVVLSLPDLSIVEVSTALSVAEFPYISGFLAFREVPVLLAALDRLSVTPDVLVCDGYGIAHPRRFGLGCHLGVVTGLPAFGVAKTPFVGTAGEIGPDRGDWAPLEHEGETVGRAVRTQAGVKPVYVSAGHLTDVDDATVLTLRLAPTYRLPETTRQADRVCRAALAAP